MPVPTAVGVYVTLHETDAPVPDSVQVVNMPVPLDERVTVPAGVVGVADMSVTVTTQLVALLTTTVVGWHVIVVVVACAAWALTCNENWPELALWFVSLGLLAVIVSVLGAVPEGVYCAEHVADAVVPDRVHVPVNVPVPLVLSPTVPVGVMKVPGELSETVTLQIAALPTVTGDTHVTEVVVILTVTVIATLPDVLLEWVESPE
jgi:hypothetical protein